LQIGGSDQWGNITAGVELVRRASGAEAHAVTLPLVTTAAGTKFGKSEAGAVWLDPAMTSPYRFFQFWINSDDRDVARYLRYFTLMPQEEVEALERSAAARPEAREAQQALAREVTARVHGADAARLAADASRVVFDRELDPRELGADVLESLMVELPSARVTADDANGAVGVFDAFMTTGLVKSKGDARRLLQQGGLYVNGSKLSPEDVHLDRDRAIHGRFFVLRKGGRDIGLLELG
jgi:tyrosyl-tRNA synthetase